MSKGADRTVVTVACSSKSIDNDIIFSISMMNSGALAMERALKLNVPQSLRPPLYMKKKRASREIARVSATFISVQEPLLAITVRQKPF
jgi:hypothetical protein